MLGFLQQYVQEPLMVLWFIPFFVFFAYLLLRPSRTLQPTDRQHGLMFRRRRIVLLFLRGVLFLCLFIALASPYLSNINSARGDPRVTILIDNSTSFDLFDRSEGERVYEALKDYLQVDLAYVGSRDESPLGDAATSYMEKGSAVLFVSDGHVISGMSLQDAALVAQDLNVTFNALKMEPQRQDYSVRLLGSSKLAAGIEAVFQVVVEGTETDAQPVRVFLDGDLVFDKMVSREDSFIKTFPEPGYYLLKAELEANDYFSENNVFYKTVKIIPKPMVAYLGVPESPLLSLASDLYTLAEGDITSHLHEASAIIVNDQPASTMDDLTQTLKNYVMEGNGLVVFGGRSSFEYGDYKSSAFEDLLPVRVGSAEKTGEEVSVVVVIDISESAGETLATAKSLAWSTIEDIRKENFLGVVAFDTHSYTLLDMQRLIDVDLAALESKIASLTPGGGTSVGAGLEQALQVLTSGTGGKNIILISDGQTQERDRALAAAESASASGVKIFAVGVEDQDPDTDLVNKPLLLNIALISGGSYFEAYEGYKLEILFGDPDQTKKDAYGLFIIDQYHFITERLDVSAQIYGFNEAVPRSSALLLVTTDTGEPLVAVWRYGLGRVAVVLTDDGTLYGGELVSNVNSRLLVRILNWVVGDPERRLEAYTSISDAYAGDSAEIMVKGNTPGLAGVSFAEVEPGVYRGLLPVVETGVYTTLGALHAVNEPQEYYGIGLSPALSGAVAGTGGKLFDSVDIAAMVDAFKRQSFRDVVVQRPITGWFVGGALVLLLLELALRRLWQYKNL